HAYAFMDSFWDREQGGVYWSCTYSGQPLDTMKHTYAQSFAIYALSAFAVATGEPEPLRRAMALYELIETRMKDEIGYLEAFDRSFKPLDNQKLSDNPKLMARGLVAEKTMNTMLHVLEAYTSLYEAGRDERVKASLRKLLLTIGEKVYNRRDNRLEVFFDPQLHSIFNMQSYGHDIEASWLIDLAARAVLDPEERSVTALWTSRLANGVLTRAFRNGSLLNECAEGEEDATRIWWVQAETAVGIVNLWQKTGEACLLNMLDQQWRYIQTTLVDPREGSEWYWCVDANGTPERKPIVEPWKCPYHNGRMCLELMARL
ncbi:MAG TPA: AGE family epimerase/isomerase, partial [Candidatus Limiplasma sp.]|nr:AGE family epimerase/isomerase [Candidatus Limiplasma sp.]